ncbi:uncharacterized protein Z518_05706 [Rhinocladiella mackenziei CBS 650.93]|uniref:Azaphilone pigments biosynthesis cluster protein L N-terminal domain-containing protein n=1 Tax=Rhinocladiella mackenziei CBS 650.93 TaxID=1442369 RepID=A0A0D2J6Y0_9EURO|nr:uncharacterized protein Z518_05706 [Rhinocladiella mackenziei CBS 650.93]KIX04835.1 hypothetical protein Z518_05706 [Rhinocladiella mackenziei CBS 650.93]
MPDPLSITASLLAITTAAVQSTKSLYETVKRFKDRDKTLRRLQDELKDLINILDSLSQVTNAEQPMLTLLQGPIERCSQVCREFEQSMEVFGKSKTGFRDWTKMEFMRGDINEFIDTIAGYKSTISVGIGTITLMHTSKISRQVLQEYNEMIQDTAYNLELRLWRIDEKMTRLNIGNTNTSGVSIDLEDEREVTKQCLRICEDARSYIESLSDRESSLLPETPQHAVEENSFEAPSRTRQVLDESRDSFAETIGYLQKRLDLLVRDDDPEKDNERSRLLADINVSKQCLDVCKVASEVSRQKVYRIGEVIAEGDSDQVVVTTLADLFDIRKALSKDRSAQLVGSMTAENLQHLTEKRYSSRFGTSAGHSDPAEAGTTSSSAVFGVQKSKHAFAPQSGNHEQSPGPRTRQNRPSPNEMRKRPMDSAIDQEKG